MSAVPVAEEDAPMTTNHGAGTTATDLVGGGEIFVVSPTDSLRSAATVLFEHAVGTAVVIENGKPVGMFSERDAAAAVAHGADVDSETVRSWMSTYVVSARPQDRLVDLASQMIDGEIRHVPVLDDAGALIGVVSLRDVVRPLLIEALTRS
jgi:CBS domain-containing protein